MTADRQALLDELARLSGDPDIVSRAKDVPDAEVRTYVEALRAADEGIRRYGRLGYMWRVDGSQPGPFVVRSED